jgi:CBS domain-containing protein
MIGKLATTPMEALMTRDPVTFAPSTPLVDVVHGMRDRFGSASIVDHGKLVGIFTERDLMLRVDHDRQAWHRTAVGEVMTKSPRTLKPGSTIAEAIVLMSTGLFRHVPIVDRDDTLVGIVSIRDVLRYAVERYPQHFVNLPPEPKLEASKRWGG